MNWTNIIYPAGFAAALLVLWELLARVLQIPVYLLPAPSTVLTSFSSGLLGDALVTLGEAIFGFAVAGVLAFIVAVAFVHCRPLEKGAFPLAVALKTTPLVALAPLLIIWLGSGLLSKVAASALICFFPVLVTSVKGLRTLEPEALDLFRTYGASRPEVFWRLRLPNSLPYVISGLKISTSLAVVGAIVGEFVGASKGLGYVVLVASYHMETPRMFAAIFCAAGIGLLMFWGVGLAEKILVFWQQEEHT